MSLINTVKIQAVCVQFLLRNREINICRRSCVFHAVVQYCLLIFSSKTCCEKKILFVCECPGVFANIKKYFKAFSCLPCWMFLDFFNTSHNAERQQWRTPRKRKNGDGKSLATQHGTRSCKLHVVPLPRQKIPFIIIIPTSS